MKKRVLGIVLVCCLLMQSVSCSSGEEKQAATSPKKISYAYEQELNMKDDKYRNYYEVFLYSYCDSNGDGIGDINGLISKLDYISTEMGYNGIWLMPVMPSPSYHKYDVTDYLSIDPSYGTLDDFKNLLSECHKRGIRLIIDLVLNHTSSSHPWFLKAKEYYYSLNEGDKPDYSVCPYAEYYNFTSEANKGGYADIGNGRWFYECQFSTDMPDLNWNCSAVYTEVKKIIDFWLDLGVDGFRLDAAKEYYSGSTKKNTKIVDEVAGYVHKKNEDAYVVAEVWQDFYTMIQYYDSDVDSLFNFSYSQIDGEISKDIMMQDGQQFASSMQQIQEEIAKVSKKAIDAQFFTNHDTPRAASAFRYDEDKIKLAAGMTMMMSGTVFTYYGEEVGMTGSGEDPNKRAPMPWSSAQDGMTAGPGDSASQVNKFGTVSDQKKDDSSILNYYKRALRIRNENPEIARGKVAVIDGITQSAVAAVTKTYEDSTIVLLYNLSDKEQKVSLPAEKASVKTVRGYLSNQGDEVILSDNVVTLPPYAIAVLK